ncbi:MAG TPA: hypothetical protein VM070_00185 [Candidatus Saccharimonadales bacterium]|nr:hypothetical protein [Candidatus Saccharimonadales bacterium]
MHRARSVILIAAAAILAAPSCPAPSESHDPLPVRTHEPSPAGSTLVSVADFTPSRNGSLTVVAMPSGRVVNRLDGRSSPPPTVLPGTRYAFLADLFSDRTGFTLKLYRTDLFTGVRTLVVDVGQIAPGVAVLGTTDGERAYVLNAPAGDGDRQVRLTGYDGGTGRLIAEHAWPLRAGETAGPQLAVLEDGRLLAATRITAVNGLTAAGWTVFDRDLGRGTPVAAAAPELAGFIRRDGCDPWLRQAGDGRLVTVCGGSRGAVATVAVFDPASLQLVDHVPIGAGSLVPSLSGEPAGRGSRSVLAWSIGSDGLVRILLSHLVTATVDVRTHRVTESVALDLGGASLDRTAFRDEPLSGRLALILDAGNSQRLELADLARPNDRAIIYTAPVIRAVREAGDHIYVLAADSRDANERLVDLDRSTGRVLARSAPLPRHAAAIVTAVVPSGPGR